MERLNIDWLHNPVKEGRRSGRATDMLANVVGIAQLAHETSHVMVVSSNAFNTYNDFIDVLRTIDPVAKYSRTICRGYPSIIVRSEYGAPCYVMFSERNVIHWANGMRNAYQVVDHHFAEMEIRRNNEINANRMATRRNIHGMGRLEWWLDI